MTGPPRLLDPRDDRPEARARLRAWMELHRRLALHPEDVRRLLELEGSDAHRILRLLPSPPGRSRSRRPLGLEPDAAQAAVRRVGVVGLVHGSPAYPPALAALADPPLLLWVQGDPGALRTESVAIVGARAATATGRHVARGLARDLAELGLTVVSGLARGIDAEAHRGALEGGGTTVAVLACGPDRIYPPEHAPLAREIAASGALVSELPPGAPPLAAFFPLRNRLISGLAKGVVVVEARPRSGSLITARHALDQGREVLVVPGPVDAVTSEGSNRLFREGAAAALDATDVLRVLGWDARRATRRPRRRGPVAPLHPIVSALREAPATRDELARRLGCPAAVLARELALLELDGAVVEERDGRLRAPPGASPWDARGSGPERA